MSRLGWDAKEGDSDLDKLLRVLAIGSSSKYGDQSVIDEAIKRFRETPDALDDDIRGKVYRIVVKHGDAEDYEKILSIYRNAPMQAQKLQALSALGATTDESLIQRTLEFSLSEEVRTQDLIYGVSSVSSDVRGSEHAWRFLTSHWAEYNEKLAGSGYLLAACIKSAAGCFSSEARALEIEAFFQSHPTPQAERAVQQTLESIRSRSAWFSRDCDKVAHFFAV